MKCKKLTFISPLHGSVVSEELIYDSGNRIDFDAESVFSLYERTNALDEFLGGLQEDLVEYVPEILKSVIVKASFGKYTITDSSIYLVTEIYTRRELNDEEAEILREWITGQLSDGWGEGVEQKEAYVETIDVETLQFDVHTCDFERDTYRTEVNYYVHPWASEDWCLELSDVEEVELDIFIEEPVVHSSYCMLQEDGNYKTRTVYKIADKHSAMLFIKNSGHLYSDELIRLIDEQGCLGPAANVYAVYLNEGLLCKFLPIVGFVNPYTQSARLFEIDAESGEIDMQDYKDGKFKGFFEKLLTK